MIYTLLPLLSSILLFFSFPKFDFSLFAWVALVPFIIGITRFLKSFRSCVLISLLVGTLTYLLSLYWLIPMFLVADIHIIPTLISWFAISVYLGVYFVLWGILLYKLRDEYYKISSMLILAAAWVVLEYIRTYALTGFPWNLLAYSQWQNIYFIQIVDITGVYGVSFIIVLINLTVSSILSSSARSAGDPVSFRTPGRQPGDRGVTVAMDSQKSDISENDRWGPAVFMFLVLLFVLGYGLARLHEKPGYIDEDKALNFTIIQPNIDQYKKFDSKYLKFIEERNALLLSRVKDSDIVVWSETSFPAIYPANLNEWLDNGPDDVKHIVGAFIRKEGGYYNSAIYVDSKGNELGVYSKKHLVPFGEVFPYKNFFQRFVPEVKELGGVNAGEKFVLFDSDIGVNICFETLFPNEVRQLVFMGASVFINITNDAWYLKTSAPYQHLVFNIFRAIENRRYLLRAANTGISVCIDPYGKITDELGLYKTGILRCKAYKIYDRTFYTKYGNIFVYMCILIMGLWIFWKGIWRKRLG